MTSARDGKSGADLAPEELFDALARADVVFLGETHVDETTHRFELAAFEALLARREVVLAVEFFERDVQPALDAYLSGAIDEAAFLAQSRPWPNYRTAYRPLVELAKARGARVIASNFPAPLRQKLARAGDQGLEALTPEERRLVPEELLANTPAYWRRVDNAIRGHAGMMGAAPAAGLPRLLDTQSLWDNSMGESCARALADHPGALVLHVNGGFHSEYWDGAARQLALRAPTAKVRTVAIETSDSPHAAGVSGLPRADFVVFAESRAKDVREGAHAVTISEELKYRLFVPPAARDGARVPLLVWLGDDGASAAEELFEWKERLGDGAAILALEAVHRETQEDLVEGLRWFWPDTFTADVAAAGHAVLEAWAFVLRHHPVEPSRVCLAGEGTGATVVAALAMLTGTADLHAVARAPRRFAKIKDFPLPLPELAGDERAAARSLRVLVSPGDEAWWSGEIAEYRAIGLTAELVTATVDPWRSDLERENDVRAGLGLAARELAADAPRRFVVAESPRARAWSRRLALRRAKEAGELVAVVPTPIADGSASELPTAVRAADFEAGRPLPRCPGPFGGTTLVVLPEDLEEAEVLAWLALEGLDPLAKASRFHRLRVATAGGERALSAVLAELREQNRKNVLVVPAEFCAGGATMRALAREARAHEDAMTIHWRPGLGAP